MFDLFAAAISARLRADGATVVAEATRHLASFGITSAIDANTTADEMQALIAAARGDRLATRIGMLSRYGDLRRSLAEIEEARVDATRLRIVGAKAFADGGMSSDLWLTAGRTSTLLLARTRCSRRG